MPDDVTKLLRTIDSGDPEAAEELFTLVYKELRRIAAFKMVRESPGHTLQATSLVHEAWLRLGGDQQPKWQNRRHFFAAAGEAMRRILVDKARRKRSAKHGGELQRSDAEEAIDIPVDNREERLLALDEALELLAMEAPRKAELVKLRYFVGLTNQEAAQTMGISNATAERYWTFSKAYLFDRMRSPH